MPLSLRELLSLPDCKRRKAELLYKPRGKYNKLERPKRTQEELIAFLREHNIRSSRQVDKVRKPDDPTLSDFRTAFPKWKDAQRLAFGRVESFDVVKDPEYMAKLVVQLGITTMKGYIKAHEKMPDVVPSYAHLRMVWGGFKRLKQITSRYSLGLVLNEYMVLRRRLGGHPTVERCKASNVFLERAIEFFGSKKQLDKFLDNMEKKR